jgi:two-component system, OmpR family, heavy metal sensor histidine kinase CusS
MKPSRASPAVRTKEAPGKTARLYRSPPAAEPRVTPRLSVHSRPLLWSDGKRTSRGIAAKAPIGRTGSSPYTVAIALDIEHHEEFMSAFHETLWITFGIGIFLAVLLGWIAARLGLAPVREIGEVSKRISADRLNDRLPIEAVPAELTDLAISFNDMLARLEDSFRRLSDFSSDLAHELRTPVGNLMTQTQVALSQPRSADEYREVLYSNLEEFDRLARMMGDMLFLAKADHGIVIPNRGDIDLSKEVDALIEFYEALCEERGITMARDGEGFVIGDKLMIRRAISNLLSNAIAHTPKGGTIKIQIAEDSSKKVSITVENPGETIAPQQLPRLFDRFYRVDPARAHTSMGAGLGLAITKSIMEAHGGKISVSSEGGMTRFKLIFAASRTGEMDRHGHTHN